MRLEGSCQCGKTSFTVDSDTPVPYMICFCSICRKLSGATGGCNIMGKRATLRVRGKRYLREHHARVRNPGERTFVSKGGRWFCGECGTHLYALDEAYPEGVWPNAGAIDTELPEAPSNVFVMTRFKPRWVRISGRGPRYPVYPKLSIAQWHEQHWK